MCQPAASRSRLRRLAALALVGAGVIVATPTGAADDPSPPVTPGLHVIPGTSAELVGYCLVTNRVELADYDMQGLAVPRIAYQVNTAYDNYANAADPAFQEQILAAVKEANEVYGKLLEDGGTEAVIRYGDKQWHECGNAVEED